MQQQLAGTTIPLTEAERAANEHDRRVRQALAARPPRPLPTEEESEEAGKALLNTMQTLERDPRPWKIHEADPDRPKFPTLREWVRAPVRRPRVVAVIRPRARDREPRPAVTRRSASSSSTSSSDPGDPDPDDAICRTGATDSVGLRHVSIPLADELSRIAARLRSRGGVG